jgi:hypothetical protein
MAAKLQPTLLTSGMHALAIAKNRLEQLIDYITVIQGMV